MNSNSSNPKQAILLTEYALRLLSRRSYTLYEMRKKLQQRSKGLSQNKLNKGWVADDERIACAPGATDEDVASLRRGEMRGRKPRGAIGCAYHCLGDFVTSPKKLFNPGEGEKSGVEEGTERQGQDPVPSILSRLQELGYLNDLLFCERWVEERCRLRPRGKYALTQELRKKGIPKEILDAYWDNREKSNHELDELPLASRLIEKKRSLLEKRYESYQVKQKLSFYLASRGFSPETIHRVLDKTTSSR